MWPSARTRPARPVRASTRTSRGSGTSSPARRSRGRCPQAPPPKFSRIGNGPLRGTPFDEIEPDPNRLRWDALPMPGGDTDFVDGLYTMGGHGDLRTRNGMAVPLSAANRSMTDRYFVDADGELLFVPEHGPVLLRTELGPLAVAP